MKQRSIMGMGLAALALGLSACGGGDTSTAQTKADLDVKPASSVTAVYTFDQFFTKPLQQITGNVAQKGSIKTDLVLAGENYEDAFARVQNDVAANKPPDLAMVGLNRLQPLVDAGVALPLDETIRNDKSFDLSQYDKRFLDTMRVDGKLYGLPYAVSTAILYINADAFRKAGLDPNDPPETWEEVRAASEQLVKRRATRYGVWYGWDLTGNWLFQNLLESNGGTMMNADKSEPEFNKPAGVGVAQYWRDLVSAKLMPPLSSKDGPEAFYRGDVGMMVWSTAALAAAKESSKFDLRTGLLPIPEGGQRATPAGGNGFVILAKDAAHRKAAWEVLKALTNPEGSTTTTKLTGYMPVNAVAAKGSEYLAGFLKDRDRHTAIRQIPTLRPWFSFPGRRGVEITDVINDALFASMTGKEEPQQALDTAAERVSELAR